MNLLHFFYGVGATLGPWAGGFIARSAIFGWRNIYLLSLAPLALMAFLTFFLFPSRLTNSLNGVMQYLIGLINKFIGEAWGYRSCALFGIILLFLLAGLRKFTISSPPTR